MIKSSFLAIVPQPQQGGVLLAKRALFVCVLLLSLGLAALHASVPAYAEEYSYEDEYEQYEYWHKARLSGRPGITGMWQVSGRSNITDFEEIVALDTYYISHWNLWLDMKILAKTIQVVFSARGAE
jgi:hypothetical protein